HADLIEGAALSEPHDGALAELPVDGGDGQLEGLPTIALHFSHRILLDLAVAEKSAVQRPGYCANPRFYGQLRTFYGSRFAKVNLEPSPCRVSCPQPVVSMTENRYRADVRLTQRKRIFVTVNPAAG